MDGSLSEHLARLDLERRRLKEIVARLSVQEVATVSVVEGWTVKDVLAHVAIWDRWELEQMRCMLYGRVPEHLTDDGVDSRNEAAVEEWRDRPVAEVLREIDDARDEWLRWLGTLTEQEFAKPRTFHGEDWSFSACVRVQWEHDREHAEQIVQADSNAR